MFIFYILLRPLWENLDECVDEEAWVNTNQVRVTALRKWEKQFKIWFTGEKLERVWNLKYFKNTIYQVVGTDVEMFESTMKGR